MLLQPRSTRSNRPLEKPFPVRLLVVALLLPGVWVALAGEVGPGIVFLEPGTPPPGEPFVGMERCGECHRAIVEHWRGTAHARAWATLEAQGPVAPTCARCHATGFGRAGGLNPVTLGPEDRREVQCESCHGPAGRHLREVEHGRASTYGSTSCATGKMCIECHTPSRDPNFAFRSAWKAIAHPKESTP
jgi:hypothetical protein